MAGYRHTDIALHQTFLLAKSICIRGYEISQLEVCDGWIFEFHPEYDRVEVASVSHDKSTRNLSVHPRVDGNLFVW